MYGSNNGLCNSTIVSQRHALCTCARHIATVVEHRSTFTKEPTWWEIISKGSVQDRRRTWRVHFLDIGRFYGAMVLWAVNTLWR